MNTANPLHPHYPRAGEKLYWGQLYGSALSLAISNMAQQYAGLVVVITPDNLQALRLEYELRFYTAQQNNLSILHFPDWETLPYDIFSPHEDIISQRLSSLYRLPHVQQGILILSITTLMQRVAPQDYLLAHSLVVAHGDKFNIDHLRSQLQGNGYHCVSQVVEHGEFAVRGSIVDIFPMGSKQPYRIDLFDDSVDTIRTFDPETQRSLDVIDNIHLLPAREFPLDEQATALFRQQWRSLFSGNPMNCPIYQDVSSGLCPSGIEYYLPLFFQHTAMLLDYLPSNSILLSSNDFQQTAEHFWQEINERYQQRRHDVSRPVLEPNALFITPQEVLTNIKKFARIYAQAAPLTSEKHTVNYTTELPPTLTLESKSAHPLQALQNFINTHSHRVLFCAETTGRREILLQLLHSNGLQPSHCEDWPSFRDNPIQLGISVAPLEQGLLLNDPALCVIAESQLFGQQVMQRRRRKQRAQDPEMIVRNLTELNIGAPVVHIEHGVGRYLGLQTLKLGAQETEFLTLEYAGGDKLYVPVASLHMISRYSGADLEHAPVHRLGTEQWSKAKRRAAERVRDVAAELLDIYAKRAARKGLAFKKPDEHYYAFASAFPFEETVDQQQAIAAVMSDMIAEKPMDRLICGDVGFGKTEVAIRAAFIAVQSGKQVAVLVPTTLLAQQHYQNFLDRFADWPIRIEMLSRFRSTQEQTAIIKQLQEGKLDILIGTHKLLSQNIHFKELGLVIIDEEHRFGVQQKEKLKALRAEVDILTLTATPIPRTLNMAMAGMRELSIIATPPARRLSIKTFIHERDDGLIREAILREIMRGGQVYFLHNKVDTIEKTATEIQKLIPEARVHFAHGQMRERELEKVMSDFYHLRFNVLVCTTIIETGIDIPTANTIIIDRADLFGLAQLHQLRGRVGRSHHQAYAYLMTPPEKLTTADAQKRLQAISALEDLGAGFTLATHDLEIRGAGELLGEEQSGHIQEIGFSLYMELLERAIKSLQAGQTIDVEKSFQSGCEIDLQISTLIPEDYLPDVHARLTLYKRIANASDKQALEDLQVEMIDRFGLLPAQVKNLFMVTELKLQAQQLGIRKIEAGEKGGRIDFTAQPNVDPLAIIKLIQKYPQKYKFDGRERLRFTVEMPDVVSRLQTVENLLNSMK